MRWAGDSTIGFGHKAARRVADAARRRWRRQLAAIVAQRERWLLAAPLPLAFGIALYHALAFEPWRGCAPLAAVAALAASLLSLRLRELGPRTVVVGLALLLAGFALAQWQTQRLAQPALERPVVATFEARVVLVEPQAEGARLTLDVLPRRADLPHRVRVSARTLEGEVHAGARVALRARLLPPSEPVLPGGFDFGRWAYFNGLGAVGYAFGAVRPLDDGAAAGFLLAEVRRAIARHAVTVLPGESGGVAAALLTGLRGDIPDRVWSDMQAAGLAHLLAISGLHIGLVAGTAFVALRYAVCLWPWLALRVMAHRIAAIAALAVAFLYLLLAGAPVPTQRAFMMTAVVLLGLMVDRDAISLRLVALAALVVLALDPAALFGASFQMSFAAVTALVAVYERWRRRRPNRGAGAPSLLVAYVVGVALTTVIASLATGPIAAYHFGRLPTYGIAANLVAVPLMALWIMPLGLVSLLLMPTGLDGPFLAAMGLGIEGVLAAAAWAAIWPGGNVVLPPPPSAAVLLFALAGLWAALWSGRLTRLALVPALAGALLWSTARPPDMLVDRAAGMAALRLGPGRYALAVDGRDGFVLRGWQRALGIDGFIDAAAVLPCDRRGCRFTTADGREVAIAFRPNAMLRDCAADLVVNLASDTRCRATPTVTRGELWRAGALEIRFDNPPRLRHVHPGRARRPWQRGA